MAQAIEASHISIWRNQKKIIHDVSLTVEQGAMVSIIGPNGCGKSTLLKGLCAMLPLREGTISMGKRDIRTFGRKELARHVAILTQAHEAPGDVTVRDLVWMGRFPYRNFYRGATKEDCTYVDDAIRETGLMPYADQFVTDLSGGEQQRAWLAVMLAQQASVLLLDEPTTYLDIHHQIHMMKLLRRIHQDLHRTIIIVVHDMNQAIQYTDQVVVMDQGRIVKTGAPDQVITPNLLHHVFGVQAERFHTRNGKPCLMPVDAASLDTERYE